MVAAVGLMAAGCGGAAAKNSVATGSSCVGTGVTANQIKLGLIYPNSGSSAATFAGYRAGVDARLGVANAAGGVNGRKIVYDWADDQGLAAGNLGAARQLVNQGQAFGIVEFSTGTVGSAAFLHQQGIPVVGVGLDAVWSKYANMFSWLYTVSTGSPVSTFGDFIHAQRGTKAAVVYTSLSGASSILAGQWVASMKAAGISANTIETSTNITSPADVAAQIKAGGYDTVAGTGDPAFFVQVAILLQKQDPQVKTVVSAAGYDPTLLASVGKFLPGFTVDIDYVPFESNAPSSRAFLAAMARYSPQVQPGGTQVTLTGWLDADLMIAGLESAGSCPTRAGFIRGLRSVSSYDGGGLLLAPMNERTDFGQTGLCHDYVKISPTGDSWQVVPPAPICGHRLP
jgi:branched-chain amino acid transport system substrate-binding protein